MSGALADKGRIDVAIARRFMGRSGHRNGPSRGRNRGQISFTA